MSQVITDKFKAAAQAGTSLGMAAMDNEKNLAHATYYICGAVSGALQVLAMSISRLSDNEEGAGDDFNPCTRINADTMLFAAIMAAKTVHFDHTKKISENVFGMDQTAKFGPVLFLEAIEAFEKLTGRKPDAFLQPGLVEAARDPEIVAECMRDMAVRDGIRLN